MPPKNTMMVKARLKSAIPDRIQFKPYMPYFEFENVFVTLPLPAAEVTREGDNLVLTLDGYKALLSVAADAVDDLHAEWEKSKKVKGGK